MTFSSISFIFLFLPVVMLIYKIVPPSLKHPVLILASMVFYAWGNVAHMLLLMVFMVINYVLAIYIDVSEGKRRTRRLVEALIINIGVLLYFKYYGFLLKTLFAFIPSPPAYNLFSIPLGISFFTFSTVAYLVDVYRHEIVADRNFMNVALFISFFPKLIMGPIERYKDMQLQFHDHPQTPALFEQGCGKFMSGLALKLILANTMGEIWMQCQGHEVSLVSAWLGILAYTFQIYFDFQGYTQMAIGLGNMFGFHLSKNFQYPYMSISISDFWRRWHMTLSSWFKDYVYIPLGGNRTSFRKKIRNLMIVWLLTGLWHGASWNFLFWGGYYGILLIIEKYFLSHILKKIPKILRWLMTFLLVMIGWVFFASPTLADAFGYLGHMLMLRGNGITDAISMNILSNQGFYFIAAIICSTPLLKNMMQRIQKLFQQQLWYLKPLATACFFMIILMYLISNTYQSFLYFQF